MGLDQEVLLPPHRSMLKRLQDYRELLRAGYRSARSNPQSTPAYTLLLLEMIRELNKRFPELGDVYDGDNYR